MKTQTIIASKLAILFIFLLSLAPAAKAKKAPDQLLTHYPQQSLHNEIVHFKPIADHHINLEAPNSCGEGREIEKTKSKLVCQFLEPGRAVAKAFVCDDANTYCNEVKLNIEAQGPKSFAAKLSYYSSAILKFDNWKTPRTVSSSPNKGTRGFVHNNFEEAIRLAKRDDKPIFIFFTQQYCPPCNLMKETSFYSDAFQEAMKSVVLLQVDTDLDHYQDEMKKFNVRYTPTLLLVDKDLNSIARSAEEFSPHSFKIWLAKNLPYKNSPIDVLLKKLEDKKLKSSLTDLEIARLTAWFAAGYENEKIVEHFSKQKIRNHEFDLYKRVALFESDSKKANIKKLEQLQKDIPACNQSQLYSRYRRKSLTLSKRNSQRVLALIEKSLQAAKTLRSKSNEFELDCAVEIAHLFTLKSGVYKNQLKNKKAAKNALFFADQAYKTFPIIAGAINGNALKVERWLLDYDAKDPGNSDTVASLKKKDPNNFSYDYLNAGYANYKGDHEAALKAYESAEAKALGRQWEKVKLGKIAVLIKMKKFELASKEINSILNAVELPRNQKIGIHKFVAKLRGYQASLLTEKKSSNN